MSIAIGHRRDWAGRDCDTDTAYCTINHKEFFSEISVAYLCNSYGSLDADIREGDMASCSPPFLSDIEDDKIHILCCFSRLLCKKRNHCNKFFPFTRRQLEIYDPATFSVIRRSWDLISSWDDPHSNNSCTSCFRFQRQNDLNMSLLKHQTCTDDDFETTVSF